MRFRDDERAQSVQIGAVLLFATFVVAFASYQAFVVPNQNEEVEFNHNQQVQGELQELRNAVVSMAGGGSPRSTSVTLGTTYPSRLVATNPPPAVGRLRTVGSADPAVNVSVRNAVADGEAGDFWSGDPRNYSTGAVEFTPGYNVYAEAPTTVYEHSVLHNEFGTRSLPVTDQAVVDGNRISLVALNGSLARTTSGTAAVDARPISASTRTVTLSPDDPDRPMTVTVPSRLPVSKWQELLAENDDVTAVSGSVDYPAPFEPVTLELAGTEPYTLRLTKVGVGSGTTDEPPAYVVPVGDGDRSVGSGATREIEFEVRDAYNNPVSGVTVRASADSGSLADESVESGRNGRAVFEYTAPSRGTDRVNVSVEPGYAPDQSSFDPTMANTSQVTVSVGGSGGESGGVSASWYSPTVDNSGGLSDCSASACTFDVSEHGDQKLTLRAGTDPPFDGVDVEFRTSEGVGSVSPTSVVTDASGNATTEFTARENGSVDVYFGSASGRDLIALTVTGVTGSMPLSPTGEFAYADQSRDRNIFDTVQYELDWSVSDTNGDLASVRLFLNGSDGSTQDSAQIDVGGESDSGTTTLSNNVFGGCNAEYGLKLIVTDQAGHTTTVSKTDVACR